MNIAQLGNEHKETIIFIHGLAGNQNVFKREMEYFSKQYRVMGYDYIGHGRNSSEKEYNLDNLVDELYQLFNVTYTTSAHLCCLCFGGNIANVFASRYPDKVLSICHIGGSVNGNNGYTRIFKYIWDYSLNSSYSELLKYYADRFYVGDPNHKEQEDIMIKHANMISPDIMKTSIGIRANFDMCAILKTIKVPLLYTYGEYDMLFHTCIPDIKDTVPHANIKYLPKASHVAHVFQPELFQNVYEQFLNEIKVEMMV